MFTGRFFMLDLKAQIQFVVFFFQLGTAFLAFLSGVLPHFQAVGIGQIRGVSLIKRFGKAGVVLKQIHHLLAIAAQLVACIHICFVVFQRGNIAAQAEHQRIVIGLKVIKIGLYCAALVAAAVGGVHEWGADEQKAEQ